MGVSSKKKEMLFILGQFFKETNRRFSAQSLNVSVSKAEFIDIVRELQAVATKERAIYRNLEDLQKEKYLVYDDRDLRMSRKGYSEYDKIVKELQHMNDVCAKIEAGRIRFKRKTQTKLR